MIADQITLSLKILFVLQVRGDWSGQGTLVCYSHFETTADFPEGAANAGRADVTCRPVVWEYATGLGPEAMTFQPVSGDPFDIFAVSQFWCNYFEVLAVKLE